MKCLYMAVTTDEYELPIYVEDSAQQLAEKLGITRSAVFSSISKQRSGKLNEHKVVRVALEEEDIKDLEKALNKTMRGRK